MKLGEFIKLTLEQKYLGKRIRNWSGTVTFIVSHISVEDGGVDPQWEISLESDLYKQMKNESGKWQQLNNPRGGVLPPEELVKHWHSGFSECYTMNLCDDNVPEIVADPKIKAMCEGNNRLFIKTNYNYGYDDGQDKIRRKYRPNDH